MEDDAGDGGGGDRADVAGGAQQARGGAELLGGRLAVDGGLVAGGGLLGQRLREYAEHRRIIGRQEKQAQMRRKDRISLPGSIGRPVLVVNTR